MHTARLGGWLLAAGACLALAACAVGPAYQRPDAPAVNRYPSTPTAGSIPAAGDARGPAAGAQTLAHGATIEPRWWETFDSPSLDGLVASALTHNPSLAAAEATLDAARFQLAATRGVFFPQLGFGAGSERTRTSGAASGGLAGPQLYNVHTAQVSVSYAIDVFGLNRWLARSAAAEVEVAQAQLAAARLAIAGNVVNTAIGLAALDAEIAATQQNADDQRQLLELVRKRFELGATTQFDVLTQQSQLATTEAQLTQLQQARDATRHLLATYLGEFPADLGAHTTPALADLKLPPTLPVSLPSTLVRERPDIVAAEAQLRAANAEVGAAVARMYPSVELTGAFGQQSNHGSALFDPASRLWNLAAGLALPLFEGGTLRAQAHAAEAAYQGVFASYQGTVLGAFRDVADVLRALEHDSEFLAAQARAMHDAEQALALVRIQYASGGVDFLNLLTSETQFQNARVAFVRAEAQRYADSALLYVALGGGQWAATQVAAAAPARGNDEPPAGKK